MRLRVHRRWFRLGGLVAGSVAALILAACAGGSASNPTPTGRPATNDQTAALIRVLQAPRGFRIGAGMSMMRPALGTGTLMAAMMGQTERIYGFMPCDATTNAVSVTVIEDRIGAIRVSPCGGGGAALQAAMAERLLPADATATGTLTSAGGPMRVYHSAMLAQMLDDYWFEDCSGKKVTPGTVVVAPLAGGGWDITAGTCPNTGT